MKKRIAVVFGLVVAGAAAFAGWRYKGGDGGAKPQFQTVTVDRGRIVAKVTATGTLSALVTVQVGAQVSGRIQQLFVDFNSTVKKGDVIAKLDPQLFQAAVEQARANFAAARGNFVKTQVLAAEAQRQFARASDLYSRKLVAQADLETAQSNADSTKAAIAAASGTVDQARAALNQAQVNFAYTTVRSPIDGMVISRNIDVGQTVAASLQAPTLFVIAEDLRKMQVDTSVAEADIGKLKPGMTTMFTVDAYPSKRFRGSVRQIRNSPQTVQNVVTYNAVIDVDNGELELKPGMTANVTFVYAEKDDILRVPNTALRFRPSPELLAGLRGGKDASAGPPTGKRSGDQDASPDRRTVWVLRAGRPESVAIRTGISDGTLTQLAEGELREGDPLVTEAIGGEGKTGAQRPGGGTPGLGGPSGPSGPGMRRMF